jgi:hypothetical protein
MPGKDDDGEAARENAYRAVLTLPLVSWFPSISIFLFHSLRYLPSVFFSLWFKTSNFKLDSMGRWSQYDEVRTLRFFGFPRYDPLNV